LENEIQVKISEDAALQTAAQQIGFSYSKEATLSLKGLYPTVYLLKKQ
jgi:hypothetical protein